MARLMTPLVERDHYQEVGEQPISAPNLIKAYYESEVRDAVVLMFDQKIEWNDNLKSQFYLDGKPQIVKSGQSQGDSIILKLNSKSVAKTITYLDSAKWSQDNILKGSNGIAALTFCEVAIGNIR